MPASTIEGLAAPPSLAAARADCEGDGEGEREHEADFWWAWIMAIEVGGGYGVAVAAAVVGCWIIVLAKTYVDRVKNSDGCQKLT